MRCCLQAAYPYLILHFELRHEHSTLHPHIAMLQAIIQVACQMAAWKNNSLKTCSGNWW